MKKLILLISILFITNICFSQYASLEYWGKTVKLDRGFFEIINSKFSNFINGEAKQRLRNNESDYHKIFNDIIAFSKKSSNVWIIDEGNNLFTRGDNLPCYDKKATSTGSSKRAGNMNYFVVIPSLIEFAKSKKL